MKQPNRGAINAILYYYLLILPSLTLSFALVDVVFPFPVTGEASDEGAMNITRLEQVRWAWIT